MTKKRKNSITIEQLKKSLKKRKKEDLLEEIVNLYRCFDDVKDYYTEILTEDNNVVLMKYKKIIKDEFFPLGGLTNNFNLPTAKKAVWDYQKVSESPINVIDLMLFFVEMGADFADEYQVHGEEFYDDIEEVFIEAINLIRDNDLGQKFKKRCRELVKNATDAYGFKDILEDYCSDI